MVVIILIFKKIWAMMVKTLPIALKINSEMESSEYFKYVENIWLDVLKYESYPFTKISDKYDMFPEFLYAYHGNIIEDLIINGNSIEQENIEFDSLKFKLSVNIFDSGENFKINSHYNNAIYSEDLIQNILKNIKIVLNKFMEHPDVLLKDISLLSDGEMEKGFQIKPVKNQLIK